jgi:hypothetical protein
MNNFTQLLTKLSSDIADASDRHQLSDLMEALEAINEELHDNTTDAEFALFNKCEAEALTASRFLADEYAQEERDQFADEMQYASFSSQR